jgi:hypothetical protein
MLRVGLHLISFPAWIAPYSLLLKWTTLWRTHMQNKPSTAPSLHESFVDNYDNELEPESILTASQEGGLAPQMDINHEGLLGPAAAGFAPQFDGSTANLDVSTACAAQLSTQKCAHPDALPTFVIVNSSDQCSTGEVPGSERFDIQEGKQSHCSDHGVKHGAFHESGRSSTRSHKLLQGCVTEMKLKVTPAMLLGADGGGSDDGKTVGTFIPEIPELV